MTLPAVFFSFHEAGYCLMTSLGHRSYLQMREPPDGQTLVGWQAERRALSASQPLGWVAAVTVVRDAPHVRCHWVGRRVLFVLVLLLAGRAGCCCHLHHRRISPPHRHDPVAGHRGALEADQ